MRVFGMHDVTWMVRDREGGRLTVRLSTEERMLLDEAMALTNTNDPQEVVRVALKELVERQRFLNWVAAHERGSA
jgi:uncharacterized protein (DUF1778 family)